MQSFDLDGVLIRTLVKEQSIEIFEASIEKVGMGPGLHLHRTMEESFYVIEGKVAFMIDGQAKMLEKGGSLCVLRKTPHSWKSAAKQTKLLLIFTPSQNQAHYFAELEKHYQSGASWEKALAVLALEFDNIPVNI